MTKFRLKSFSGIDKLSLPEDCINTLSSRRDVLGQRMLRASFELLDKLVIIGLIKLEEEFVLVAHPETFYIELRTALPP